MKMPVHWSGSWDRLSNGNRCQKQAQIMQFTKTTAVNDGHYSHKPADPQVFDVPIMQ